MNTLDKVALSAFVIGMLGAIGKVLIAAGVLSR